MKSVSRAPAMPKKAKKDLLMKLAAGEQGKPSCLCSPTDLLKELGFAGVVRIDEDADEGEKDIFECGEGRMKVEKLEDETELHPS